MLKNVTLSYMTQVFTYELSKFALKAFPYLFLYPIWKDHMVANGNFYLIYFHKNKS